MKICLKFWKTFPCNLKLTYFVKKKSLNLNKNEAHCSWTFFKKWIFYQVPTVNQMKEQNTEYLHVKILSISHLGVFRSYLILFIWMIKVHPHYPGLRHIKAMSQELTLSSVLTGTRHLLPQRHVHVKLHWKLRWSSILSTPVWDQSVPSTNWTCSLTNAHALCLSSSLTTPNTCPLVSSWSVNTFPWSGCAFTMYPLWIRQLRLAMIDCQKKQQEVRRGHWSLYYNMSTICWIWKLSNKSYLVLSGLPCNAFIKYHFILM